MHPGGKRARASTGEDGGERTITGFFEDFGQAVQIGKGEGITRLWPIERNPPDALGFEQINCGLAQSTVCHRETSFSIIGDIKLRHRSQEFHEPMA